MEVAIARVYNWEVVQKRKDKVDDEASGSKSKEDKDESND
jgi:hypothetical protein